MTTGAILFLELHLDRIIDGCITAAGRAFRETIGSVGRRLDPLLSHGKKELLRFVGLHHLFLRALWPTCFMLLIKRFQMPAIQAMMLAFHETEITMPISITGHLNLPA